MRSIRSRKELRLLDPFLAEDNLAVTMQSVGDILVTVLVLVTYRPPTQAERPEILRTF